jgi:hypothetical protein
MQVGGMGVRSMSHWVASVLVCVASAAAAQDLRGTVSDSGSRAPIPGVVVVLLDASGVTLARGLTNARGEYLLVASPRATRLRLVRLGFRPREIPVTGPMHDVRLMALPTLLESVRVVANAGCPHRRDREAAFALLEQARAGLLNAVVARETHRASMTLLAFERVMHGTSDSVVRLNVRSTSGGGMATSFSAAYKAREFVRDGFVRDSAGSHIYFGPDIDVLLDDDLNLGYCFHLREPEPRRPTQVGLAFVPATRQRDRIDIDGTLWIDTAARKLQELEYAYVGLPSATVVVRAGGRTTFWELPNGVVFIDKWYLRLPQVDLDTAYTAGNERIIRQRYVAKEPGGEVATATWPDGQSYQGPLGVLHARTVDASGNPATGIVVRLSGTDYLASPDSAGLLEIENLIPGPYSAVVIHKELADYGMTFPVADFVATRNRVAEKTMVVPPPQSLARQPCVTTTARYIDDPLLVLKVTTANGQPLGFANWELKKISGRVGAGLMESRLSDADGHARQCMLLEEGDVVEARVWQDGEWSRAYRKTLGRGGNRLTIILEGGGRRVEGGK